MLNPNHFRIDAYYPNGEPERGGMTVGVGTSGVTVTHLPTGTTASVDARSQHMSRVIAIEMVEWALTYPNQLNVNSDQESSDGN